MEAQWQPIETAPKDGTLIWLLSRAHDVDADGELIHHPATAAFGKWAPDGTSWVDENGLIGCERAHHLELTGVWDSGGGWFQPDEVTHWMAVPNPPKQT